MYPANPSNKGYSSSDREEVPKGAKEVISRVESASRVGLRTNRMPFFSSTSRILFCGYSVCRNTDAGSKGKRAARHGGVSMSISSCFSGRK